MHLAYQHISSLKISTGMNESNCSTTGYLCKLVTLTKRGERGEKGTSTGEGDVYRWTFLGLLG